MTDRRQRMLALVQRGHAKQSRNNGRVPYWMHLLSVAQIVEWALEVSGELDDELAREDLYLAALGHDLYEDTAIQPEDVRVQFGERVDAWIQAMTNDGDIDRIAYVRRMSTACEEVRILKLADLAENSASVSYAIPDMGVKWTEETFLPIVTEMREALRSTEFSALPKTASLLQLQLELNYERVHRNLEMFSMEDAAKSKAKTAMPLKPAPKVISAEAWQRALERTRERERKQAERFKGRVFPVPDKDD